MRTTAWVSAASDGARGPITGRPRVGRSLRNHFDRIDHAVGDGRLTFDHAKTLSDVDNPCITDILTGSQDEIIALTEASTFPQWKRDLIALAALCRHHHGVTHRTGWSMTLDDDQIPHRTTPSGNQVIGQRHHRRQPDQRPSDPAPAPSRVAPVDGLPRRCRRPSS